MKRTLTLRAEAKQRFAEIEASGSVPLEGTDDEIMAHLKIEGDKDFADMLKWKAPRLNRPIFGDRI